ncbi:hypothetical protein Tco_0176809, partial [Tanacetum coccineum]
MTWEDFKALMKEEYCPSNKMQKLETKFWKHAMVGAGHSTNTDRFYELARLVLYLVTLETKMIERVGPRMVNPLNAKNPIAAHGACYEGVRGRAFMMGAEEARQDPNIVM